MSVELPPWLWPRAAYVHVPFCAFHCGYCDFAVVAGQDDRIDAYLDALSKELATLGRPQPVATLFVGGGTPTHLPPPQLARLLRLLRDWIDLQPGFEFSVEANPGTLDADKISVLANGGVNRVSLGAQSFQPHVLKVLERDHGPDDVRRAVDHVKKKIDVVSLDLIFGVPGQDLADWESDLQGALELRPDHLATYGLTYEKGTRLWKQRQRAALQPLSEDVELAMYELAMDKLSAAGLEHYEISNFARAGRRCRHNEAYWANEAYFGFGLGAARYVHGRREHNTRDLATYLRRLAQGQSPTFQSETLAAEDRARETIGLNLRRAEGVIRAEFVRQTGHDLDQLAGPVIQQHVASGHLVDDGAGARLTRAGRCVADSVIAAFWK